MISEVTLAAAPHNATQVGHHSQMNLGEIIEFLLTGGVVVYGTLTLLAVLGVVGGHFFTWLERRYGNVDDPIVRQEERARRKAEIEEQQRIVAVISAAVAQVVEAPHRVVSFKQVGPSNWSLEGRAQHHSSHKVR